MYLTLVCLPSTVACALRISTRNTSWYELGGNAAIGGWVKDCRNESITDDAADMGMKLPRIIGSVSGGTADMP